MILYERKGNMYEFVTHTWNPIKGKSVTTIAVIVT